jgi:alkaline phosphatase D
MPNFPYRGPQHRKSIKGFDLLTDYLFSTPTRSVLQPSETEEASDDSDAPSVTATEAPSPTEQDINEDIPMSSQAEFMLFLGDFIYADVPMYTGDNKEAYRRLYRRNYRSDSFRKLYEKLREFCLEGNETLVDVSRGQLYSLLTTIMR